jgi:uncharacterized protein
LAYKNAEYQYNNMNKILAILAALLLSSGIMFSQDFPPKPVGGSNIFDFAEILDPLEESALQEIIDDFFISKEVYVYLTSVTGLSGIEPTDYTNGLVDFWEIDQSLKTVFIMLKPKYPDERGEIYMALYGGIEDDLLNTKLKKLIDTHIIPYFKEGKLFEGLKNGLIEILKAI